MKINLDGKKFSPVKNSENGRVSSDAIFSFRQRMGDFSATYAGEGFSDGHLIGRMTTTGADLVYHCRSDEGKLEVGEAKAIFNALEDGRLSISMAWQWLNGSRTSGTSYYEEIK